MVRRPTRLQVKDYVLTALLSVGIIWLIFLIWNIAQKEETARRAVKDTRTELATLQAREATLRANVAELETPRGQEASLRETFGVAKPGEEVIIVVPPASTTPEAQKSWWQKFLGLFGSK